MQQHGAVRAAGRDQVQLGGNRRARHGVVVPEERALGQRPSRPPWRTRARGSRPASPDLDSAAPQAGGAKPPTRTAWCRATRSPPAPTRHRRTATNNSQAKVVQSNCCPRGSLRRVFTTRPLARRPAPSAAPARHVTPRRAHLVGQRARSARPRRPPRAAPWSPHGQQHAPAGKRREALRATSSPPLRGTAKGDCRPPAVKTRRRRRRSSASTRASPPRRTRGGARRPCRPRGRPRCGTGTMPRAPASLRRCSSWIQGRKRRRRRRRRRRRPPTRTPRATSFAAGAGFGLDDTHQLYAPGRVPQRRRGGRRGARRGCGLRKSCAGVCPKFITCASAAARRAGSAMAFKSTLPS